MSSEKLLKILEEVSEKPEVKEITLKVFKHRLSSKPLKNIHEEFGFAEYSRIRQEIELNLDYLDYKQWDENIIQLNGDICCTQSLIDNHEISFCLLFHTALFGNPKESLKVLDTTILRRFSNVIVKKYFSGLKFEKRVYLGKNIEVIPYPEMNIVDQVFTKSVCAVVTGSAEDLVFPYELGFFLIKMTFPEQQILRKKDEKSDSGFQKSLSLSLFTNLLSVFFGAPILNQGHSLNLPKQNPLSLGLSNFHPPENKNIAYASLEITSKTSIEEIFFQSEKLKEKERRSLEIAAKRFNYALRRTNYEDRVIDLAIALEAILLSKDSGEIKYRLATRASWFLGKKIAAREEIFQTLSQFYRFRSKIIHGEKVIKSNLFINTFSLTKQFCAEIIKRILRDEGFPDWDRIVLGGKPDPLSE